VTEGRTPDEIMTDVVALGAFDLVWEVITDLLSSVKLACQRLDEHHSEQLVANAWPSYSAGSEDAMDEVYQTVQDYVTNAYGED
jgi:hypothetical protein